MEYAATVDIVLSVYNGEKYLSELLLSLQAQTHKKWRLWIRDDGSTDRSMDLISSFMDTDPRISFSPAQKIEQRLGVIQSFSELLIALPSTSAFFLLCDQDDVWHPRKVEAHLEHLFSHPEEIQKKPYLSFSDLELINEKGEYLSSSHFRFLEFHTPQTLRFEELCAQNIVVGCTVFGNSALLQKALPIPRTALMHDWWLALIARNYGVLHFLPKPLVSYRQHSQNASGGSQKKSFKTAFKSFHSSALEDLMYQRFLQLRSLSEHFKKIGTDFKAVQALLEIPRLSRVERVLRAKELGFLPRGFERQVLFLMLLVLFPQKLVAKLSEA